MYSAYQWRSQDFPKRGCFWLWPTWNKSWQGEKGNRRLSFLLFPFKCAKKAKKVIALFFTFYSIYRLFSVRQGRDLTLKTMSQNKNVWEHIKKIVHPPRGFLTPTPWLRHCSLVIVVQIIQRFYYKFVRNRPSKYIGRWSRDTETNILFGLVI